MVIVKLQKMENIRFKIWVHLYYWRKSILVFISSTLILMGFFIVLNITKFETASTEKSGYYIRTSELKKMKFDLIKHTYETIKPSKSESKSSVKFLVNEPHFCLEEKFLYIIVIASSPKNIEKRIAIRNTWGNIEVMNETHGAIVFLLGKVHNNMRLQKQIYEESMSYRDIIQGDFIDSYRNLTQKSIMALKWFSSYCSQVKFLMKTDDDIFINTDQLSRYLMKKRTKSRWIVGCVKMHAVIPIKMKKNKALLRAPLPYGYPAFLAGAGYVISGDIVEALYEQTQRLRIVPVEDVFVTGYCAKSIGILPEHNPRFSCGEAIKDYCVLANTMITGHKLTPKSQEMVWDLINDPKSCNLSYTGRMNFI